MALWQQILWGLFAVFILVFFWPTAKREMEESKKVENPDWMGALVPIGAVVLFIILLIVVARS